jgi:hypothetical protein
VTPFDISKNILKKETKLSSEVIDKDGNPWMLNRIMSNDEKYCILATELNHVGYTNKMVYDFYYHGLVKTNKYIPYNSKKATVDTEIKYLMDYYKCSQATAKQYLVLISKEEKQMIVDFFEKRGSKK